jgi:hypothetical protein
MRQRRRAVVAAAAIIALCCVAVWIVDGGIARRSLVVSCYVMLGLGHGVEAVLTAPFSMQRARTNWLASKISFYSLYAFTRPDDSPYYVRFDFHHLSYGLAAMLLPGSAATTLGKALVFDELVNYNFLGVFIRRGCAFHMHAFDGIYQPNMKVPPPYVEYIPIVDGSTDGGEPVLRFGIATKGYRLFPVDDLIVEHWSELLAEITYVRRPASIIRLLGERLNWLIDHVAEPYLRRELKDRCRVPQPPLKIQVDLAHLRATS